MLRLTSFNAFHPVWNAVSFGRKTATVQAPAKMASAPVAASGTRRRSQLPARTASMARTTTARASASVGASAVMRMIGSVFDARA